MSDEITQEATASRVARFDLLDSIALACATGHCQVNRIHSEISVNCRWLLYAISMA